MRWRSEVDYHGSRSYSADVPEAGLFGPMVAWMAKIIGRKAPRPDELPAPANGLLVRGEHGFSMLGNRSSASLRKPADCPFPVAPASTVDRRDFRLLS